jgi:hypothetical protein
VTYGNLAFRHGRFSLKDNKENLIFNGNGKNAGMEIVRGGE